MFAGEWNVLSRPNNKVVGPNGVLMGTEGGAGIISPTALDGLALWLDAIDQNSLLASDGSVIEDGEAVALWSDKSGNSAENGLLLNGATGNYASTPDSAAIPNDTFDFIFRITPPTWASSDPIFGHGAGNGTRAIGLRHLTAAGSRGLRLAIYFDGINATTYDTTADLPFSTFESGWIRVTRDGTTGDVTFYSSTDGVSWAQVGAVVSGATGAFFDSSEPFWLGAFSTTGAYANTRFNYAELRTSIGGAATVQIDFSTASKLATSFVCTTGQTVTINTTGATGARISGARDLYQGTVANRPVFLKYNGEKYGFIKSSGCSFYTPSSTALNVSSGIEIIAHLAADDWTPSGIQCICAKGEDFGSANYSYYFYIVVGGDLRLSLSEDGATVVSATADGGAGFTDGQDGWVKVNWRASDGRVQFFKSSDGASWTQIGADKSIAIASIYAGTKQLNVGTNRNAASGSVLTGKFYSLEIKDSIDGTTVGKFNPSDYPITGGSTFVSSATGETWTLKGGSHIVQRTGLYFDGSNDYLKSALSSLSQPENVYFVGEQVSWADLDTLYDGNAATSGRVVQSSASPNIALSAPNFVTFSSGEAVKKSQVVIGVINGGSSEARINRLTAATGNAGASDMGGFTLGSKGDGTGPSNIFVHEILIYDTTAQSTATQDRVALYAGKKWGFST